MPGAVLCCPEDVRFEQPTAPAIIKLIGLLQYSRPIRS